MNQEPTPQPVTARPGELGPGSSTEPPALPSDARERWPDGSGAEQRVGPTISPETAPPEVSSGPRAWYTRPEQGFDLLRVYLGIGLMVRGALFARDPALIDHFIDSGRWLFPMLLAHALMLSHFVGGLLLALGCCTRLAAAVQIPFVAGAVFLVHWHEGLLAQTQSLEFAALVLFALIVYVACGGGHLSVDYYLQRARPEVATAEPALTLQRGTRNRRASTSRESELVLQNPRPTDSPDLGSARLALPKDPAYARKDYRDVKRELTIVLVAIGVFVVLLARGMYAAAPLWVIATMVLMVVWRVGQTELPG